MVLGPSTCGHGHPNPQGILTSQVPAIYGQTSPAENFVPS